jgi:hypothetical protein
MKDVLEEAGVEITKENKKDVDRIIHGLVDEEYKNCSPTWKAVKAHIKSDETARLKFIEKLKRQMSRA